MSEAVILTKFHFNQVTFHMEKNGLIYRLKHQKPFWDLSE